MTDDHDAGHGDASLDVIALLEASIREDDDGYEALLKGITEHGSISHVIGTLAATHAHMMIHAFGGREGALRRLAEERGGELAAADGNEHVHEHTEMDAPEEIAYQLSELNEKADASAKSLDEIASSLLDVDGISAEIARLTDAVARVGDILDKRLS